MNSLLLKKIMIRTGLARLFSQVHRLFGGGENYLHYYSNRLLSAPHAELAHFHGILEMNEPDGIDLALGAPRFDLMPSVSTKLPVNQRGYPPAQGLLELREIISTKLWQKDRIQFHPRDEVLVTHGAAGAFTAALDTFINSGDKVVLFDPSSLLYPFALKQRRAKIQWIPTFMEDGRLRFRLDNLARCLHRARMIVLANPNNPTGGIVASEDLEQIAWWANYHDVLIFNDTTFEAFHYERFLQNIAACPSARKRTITAGSVSKSHALASARIGWLTGEKHLVGACAVTSALQTPFVPTLCQQIALQALQLDNTVFNPILEDFRGRRQYTFDRLKAMGLEPYWPAGSFFFWVPVDRLGMTARVFANQLMMDKRVVVWPGEVFGPSGRNHIRISFAIEEGRLREGLTRMAEFVGKGRKPLQILPFPEKPRALAC